MRAGSAALATSFFWVSVCVLLSPPLSVQVLFFLAVAINAVGLAVGFLFVLFCGAMCRPAPPPLSPRI